MQQYWSPVNEVLLEHWNIGFKNVDWSHNIMCFSTSQKVACSSEWQEGLVAMFAAILFSVCRQLQHTWWTTSTSVEWNFEIVCTLLLPSAGEINPEKTPSGTPNFMASTVHTRPLYCYTKYYEHSNNTKISISAISTTFTGVMTYQVCPAQPYLPIYAIFAGVSCIVMCTYGLILQLVERRKNSKTERKLSPSMHA